MMSRLIIITITIALMYCSSAFAQQQGRYYNVNGQTVYCYNNGTCYYYEQYTRRWVCYANCPPTTTTPAYYYRQNNRLAQRDRNPVVDTTANVFRRIVNSAVNTLTYAISHKINQSIRDAVEE